MLKPDLADSLRVLASTDGMSWTEIDRVTGMDLGWQRRLVKLSQVLPPDALAGADKERQDEVIRRQRGLSHELAKLRRGAKSAWTAVKVHDDRQ